MESREGVFQVSTGLCWGGPQACCCWLAAPVVTEREGVEGRLQTVGERAAGQWCSMGQ